MKTCFMDNLIFNILLLLTCYQVSQSFHFILRSKPVISSTILKHQKFMMMNNNNEQVLDTKNIEQIETDDTKNNIIDYMNIPWFKEELQQTNARLFNMKEWQDEEWRINKGGWVGYDFMHSKYSPVKIFNYILLNPWYPDKTTMIMNDNDQINSGMMLPRIVGIVEFTKYSESHQGLCHGGTFCAVMDDAIGWMGFCVKGDIKPWSGYTVQINTSLKNAVKVGSILKIIAWIDRIESPRKYWIKAKLIDPEDNLKVYCEGEGLFLLSPEYI